MITSPTGWPLRSTRTARNPVGVPAVTRILRPLETALAERLLPAMICLGPESSAPPRETALRQTPSLFTHATRYCDPVQTTEPVSEYPVPMPMSAGGP